MAERKKLTIQELRVELDWFCGCGNPEDAADAVLRILDMHPLHGHFEEFAGLFPDTGIRYLVLYMLDSVTERHNPHRWGWFEHGSAIAYQWLTPIGEAVRDGLRAEKERDNYERLFPEIGACVHGWANVDEGYEQHDCMAAEASDGE